MDPLLSCLRDCAFTGDPVSMLALADLLTERNQDPWLAQAFVYCARRGRHPLLSPKGKCCRWRASHLMVRSWEIDPILFGQLHRGQRSCSTDSRLYRGHEALEMAYRDLAEALERISRACAA